MSQPRRANRGPGAAAENRAALIQAAREVFATGGYDVPLSAVARRAGVGQGSLYRHFPDRASLGLAVFEENITELERLAADPAVTLGDVLDLLTEQTVASTAFIDMVGVTAEDPRIADVHERLSRVLAGKLATAQHAGRIRPDVTAADLVLGVGMLAGVLGRVPAAARRETADRASILLRRAVET